MYLRFFILFFICCSAHALRFSELDELDSRIYQEPWLTYQDILSLTPKLAEQSTDMQLAWYVAKAKTENALYSFELYEKTVNSGLNLLNSLEASRYRNLFNYFSAKIAQQQYNHEKAEVLLKQVIVDSAESGEIELSMLAKLALAKTLSITKLPEAALTNIQEAYLTAFSLDNRFLLALTNMSYGFYYRELQFYAKSIEHYQSALETFKQYHYVVYTAQVYYDIATTYRYWQDYSQALEYYERFATSISFTPDREIAFYSAYGLAFTLAEQGKCEESLPVLAKTLSLATRPMDKFYIFHQQALCFIATAQIAHAEAIVEPIQSLLNTYPQLNTVKNQLALLNVHSLIANHKGQYKTAFDLLTNYHQGYLNLVHNNAEKRLADIKANNALEQQKYELRLQQQINKVALLSAEQKSQRSMMLSYFIILIACIVIILSSIVILQYRYNKRIELLTIKDELTSLYNRAYMFKYWQKLIDKQANKGTTSVLLIDIDNFKQVNDLYGYSFGDRVLKELADIFTTVLRTEDVVGRIGGKEFLCILPRIEQSVVEVIAERLLTAVAKASFKTAQQQKVNITISVGIRIINAEESIDLKSLYRQVAQALEQAKEAGKNCFFVA